MLGTLSIASVSIQRRCSGAVDAEAFVSISAGLTCLSVPDSRVQEDYLLD